MNKRFLALALLAVSTCSGPVSDEEMIEKFMRDLTGLAEKGDLAGVMSRIDTGYVDFQGRDKAATEALIGEYLRSRRGIVVHLLGTEVERFDPDGRAHVRAEMMLSSGAAEALRKLIRYPGDYYRFRLTLNREAEGGWLIESAGWESLPVGDLLPESVEILRKLFPDR